ncbi:class II aldolase/adducin family protein [Candidatus Sumerlaeota bacterium]|nr:class II aldolase/adducin family protein [Candidatus Sumerlaeota bacterium]
MKKVITARDVEAMLKNGGVTELPPDAILTPSARDLLGLEGRAKLTESRRESVGGVKTTGGASRFDNVTADSPKEVLEAYLNSPELLELKKAIVDIGRRMWNREYVDGNGGNISIRVKPDIALCTPTLVSKGFMQPEDLCLVNLEGDQLAGRKRRTSEILMHLEVMKAVPRAMAVAHCHPPYATAFAVSGVKPPNKMLPEFEVFIGEVPIAAYETPGTKNMALNVAQLAPEHNTILMANHGVVAWSHLSVEDAYFKMEILEAYCRTIMVTTQLGKTPEKFTGSQMRDLLNLKKGLEIPDPRFDLKEAELGRMDADWRPGVTCVATRCGEELPDGHVDYSPQAEEVVKRITDEIMKRTNQG